MTSPANLHPRRPRSAQTRLGLLKPRWTWRKVKPTPGSQCADTLAGDTDMLIQNGPWGLQLGPNWVQQSHSQGIPTHPFFLCSHHAEGVLPKMLPGFDACMSSSPAFGTPSLCLPSEPLFILQSLALPPSPGTVTCPGLELPIYSRCVPLPNHILTLPSDRVCKCLCFLLHRARAACI